MPDSAEIFEARARIMPARPDVSEQQDREAAVRYYFDEYLFDSLMAVDIAKKLLLQFEDRISADPEMQKEYDFFKRLASGTEAHMEIEDIVSHSVANVNPALKGALAKQHEGDCTAVSCSCSRCWAEDYYKLPSTVSWKGKHEGWRLYNLAKKALPTDE